MIVIPWKIIRDDKDYKVCIQGEFNKETNKRQGRFIQWVKEKNEGNKVSVTFGRYGKDGTPHGQWVGLTAD